MNTVICDISMSYRQWTIKHTVDRNRHNATIAITKIITPAQLVLLRYRTSKNHVMPALVLFCLKNKISHVYTFYVVRQIKLLPKFYILWLLLILHAHVCEVIDTNYITSCIQAIFI